jgi:hypothetical protein
VGPRCEPGTCGYCDFKLSGGYKSNADWYGGHFVCESVNSTANFNLITAAPKMLAALKELHGAMLDLPPQRGDAPAAMTRAWFAIAKAEGRDAE